MHEEVYTAPSVEEKVSTPESKEDYKAELHREFVNFLEPFMTVDTKFEEDEDGNEATLFRDVPIPREQLAHLSYKYPQKEKGVYVLKTELGALFMKRFGTDVDIGENNEGKNEDKEKYTKYIVTETSTGTGWFIKPKE